jgi:hypothetical protein
VVARKAAKQAAVYQLKITLKGIRPPIWRRVQMTSDMNLGDLNWVLQVVMPWSGFHAHAFTVNGVDYNEPDPEYGSDMEDEAEAQLGEVIPGPGFKFTYEFDFGDAWLHDIRVEKILPIEAGVQYPICLAGKRAGPPEDCGGVRGYYGLLQALQDPRHPDHDQMLEWMGAPFAAEAFDLDEVNERLSRFRR